MIETLISYDHAFTAHLLQLVPRSPMLDSIFAFLSLDGLTIVVWAIMLFLFISWEEYHHHKFMVYFLLSFGITSFLVNIVYKSIVQRVRPWMMWNIADTRCPADFSFPSGHAAGAFAGAVIFAHFDPRRAPLYYLLALLISFSRIYLYCHFTLDIVVGGVIGYGVGKILLLSLKKPLHAKKTTTTAKASGR